MVSQTGKWNQLEQPQNWTGFKVFYLSWGDYFQKVSHTGAKFLKPPQKWYGVVLFIILILLSQVILQLLFNLLSYE